MTRSYYWHWLTCAPRADADTSDSDSDSESIRAVCTAEILLLGLVAPHNNLVHLSRASPGRNNDRCVLRWGASLQAREGEVHNDCAIAVRRHRYISSQCRGSYSRVKRQKYRAKNESGMTFAEENIRMCEDCVRIYVASKSSAAAPHCQSSRGASGAVNCRKRDQQSRVCVDVRAAAVAASRVKPCSDKERYARGRSEGLHVRSNVKTAPQATLEPGRRAPRTQRR